MRQQKSSSLRLLIGITSTIIIIACHHHHHHRFWFLANDDDYDDRDPSSSSSSFLFFSIANGLSSILPSHQRQKQQQQQQLQNNRGVGVNRRNHYDNVRWTAVPPTSNPKSKLNQDLLNQIIQKSNDDDNNNNLEVELKKVDIGRIWFQTSFCNIGNNSINNTNVNSITSSQLSNLYNARSIRLVWMEITTILETECQEGSDDHLQQQLLLLEKVLQQALCQNEETKLEMMELLNQVWIRDAGNTNITSIVFNNNNNNNNISNNFTTIPSPPTTFSLTIQKWNNFIYKDMCRTSVCNMVADLLRNGILVGWNRVPKSNNPTMKLNIILHESTLTLELLTLVRPIHSRREGELPKPGFKRIESFMICKSAGTICYGDKILDPMCGCGTFLIEAATVLLCPPNNNNNNKNVSFEGIDISKSQLSKAKENCYHTNCEQMINLRYGDARRLHHIQNNSIDKIITCPPFGRQFELISKHLYNELLQEWSRILKINTGRIVLVIDTHNIESIIQAVEVVNNKNNNENDDFSFPRLQIDFMRKPFRLGKIKATVVIMSKTIATEANNASQPSMMMDKFDWEKGEGSGGNGDRTDRAHWARMRSQVLGCLIPYSASTH